MKAITVALVALTITRDAMTRLPSTVAEHEVKVVQTVFGEDNVEIKDEAAGTLEVEPKEEGERLAQKYGHDAVIRTYGENYKGAVERACQPVDMKAKGKALAPA